MKTNQPSSVPAAQLPVEAFSEVFNEVESRTGIFSQTKTIAVVSWFFNFLLKRITSKSRATVVKNGIDTTLTLMMENTSIFITISDQINEKGGSHDRN